MTPQFNNGRPILDVGGRSDPRDVLCLKDFFENTLITGGTGSGKSSSSAAAFFSALLNKEGLSDHDKAGMVVYFYKSRDVEDWKKWAWEQNREEDLIIIEEDDTDVFNLLSPYEGDDPINAVNLLMNVASITMGGSRKEGEAFWEVEMRKRLHRLLLTLQASGEPLNIRTLYRLHLSAPNSSEEALSDEFNATSLLAQLMGKASARIGEDHPDFTLIQDYFYREMLTLDERPASSIRSMTSGIMEPLISSRILSNLFTGGSTLDLNMVFSGKILLMNISVQRHEMVGRLAQCLLGYSLMKAVEKRDLNTHGNPIFFVMDECQNFLLPYSNLFMSVSRSSRAGSILITQNKSNILATLGGAKAGEAKANALVALCNVKVAHSNNDPITNDWMAQTIGKAFRNVTSVSINGQGNNNSASAKQELHYLVEPREFSLLRKGNWENNYLVDAIITNTGRTFSNDLNFIKTTFKQHFAR